MAGFGGPAQRHVEITSTGWKTASPSAWSMLEQSKRVITGQEVETNISEEQK